MKKILNTFIILSFIVGFYLPNFTSAEEISAEVEVKTIPSSTDNITLLATVNIHSAKIVSQEGNTFNISFDISNREGIQTGVKYGVALIMNKLNGSQFVVDEKVYPESITLPENSSISKNITYTAPDILGGKYSLYLTSNNESGFPFAISYLGEVKLSPLAKGISIGSDTCSVSIVGDKSGRVYTINEGVDIDKGESLKLTCDAINTLDSSVTVSPSFETRVRSLYGNVVEQGQVDTTPVTFNAQEKKSFTVNLPKLENPQVYNVKFSLNSEGTFSNPIYIKYMINGTIATINNLFFDKDSYKKGEIANLSVLWTKPNVELLRTEDPKSANIYLSTFVTNKKGKVCAEELKQLIPQNDFSSKIIAPVFMQSSCVNPEVSVKLMTEDGTVLDQKSFKVESFDDGSKSLNTIQLILILIGAIIIIALSYYLKKKNKMPSDPNNSNNSTIPLNIIFPFFILFALTFISPANIAHADTFSIGNNGVVASVNFSATDISGVDYPSTGIGVSCYTNCTVKEGSIISISSYVSNFGNKGNGTLNVFTDSHPLLGANLSSQYVTYSNASEVATLGSGRVTVTGRVIYNVAPFYTDYTKTPTGTGPNDTYFKWTQFFPEDVKAFPLENSEGYTLWSSAVTNYCSITNPSHCVSGSYIGSPDFRYRLIGNVTSTTNTYVSYLTWDYTGEASNLSLNAWAENSSGVKVNSVRSGELVKIRWESSSNTKSCLIDDGKTIYNYGPIGPHVDNNFQQSTVFKVKCKD